MGKISKLLKMQKKLVVPKGQYNSFGKYNYRSAEDIMVALKVVQEAENTVVVIDTDIETANGWNYINATATLYDADDGEVIAVTHGKAREPESKKRNGRKSNYWYSCQLCNQEGVVWHVPD